MSHNDGPDLRPVVSVVVPCLNSGQYLAETLESILQQDYPNIECIVTDGGSTDHTLDILRSYGDRIRWISEPDRGHAHAINKGWEMATGEIFAWLNADDCWEAPGGVAAAVHYLRQHPDIDVVYGDCGCIDESGNRRGTAYLHDWDLQYAIEFADHCIPQPAAFIRREILDRVGMLDESIFTKDRELWLRIGLSGKIAYYPRLLAHARNTRGISYDGKKVAPAIVGLTRKFYTLPDIPAEVRAVQRRAMSNAYLRGASYAYEGGRLWGVYCRYALGSLLADPTNLRHTIKHTRWHLLRAIRDWRQSLKPADRTNRIRPGSTVS